MTRQNRYFETIHLSFPMIERQRFLANISVSPLNSELSFLQHAMCTHAAGLHLSSFVRS